MERTNPRRTRSSCSVSRHPRGNRCVSKTVRGRAHDSFNLHLKSLLLAGLNELQSSDRSSGAIATMSRRTLSSPMRRRDCAECGLEPASGMATVVLTEWAARASNRRESRRKPPGGERASGMATGGARSGPNTEWGYTEWAARGSNPARRIKSPELYLMS